MYLLFGMQLLKATFIIKHNNSTITSLQRMRYIFADRRAFID